MPPLAALKDAAEGQILRAMTHEDHLELNRIREQTRRELHLCQQHVDRLKLSMQLVDVEHIFGGERIVVYYLAESRVDFRELVRSWPASFRPASKCGRSASATRRSSWPITATAASRSAATPTWR